MTKRKRIIYTILFLLTVGAVGYGIYWTFFAPVPPAEKAPTEQQPAPKEELPTSEEAAERGVAEDEADELPPGEEEVEEREITPEERVRQLVEDNINYVDLDGQGNARFYNEEDGKFYRVNEEGEIVQLDDKTFFNVESTAWAPTENKAVLEYPDGANIYYNFETKEQETLPKHWTEFSFESGGNKIAAKSMGYSPENRWLVESSPDGSSIKRIENIGENADKVEVNPSPNGSIVGTSRTGASQGADRQEVLFVGENQENFKSIIAPGRGFESKWSPNGEKLLFSVYNSQTNFKPELWSVNASPGNIGENRRRLNINTWVNKCAFSNDRFVYCGVPTEMPRGAGFEPEVANDIEDNIYKINIETGAKTQIPTEGESFTVESIRVNRSENKLIITTKNRFGIFEIDL